MSEEVTVTVGDLGSPIWKWTVTIRKEGERWTVMVHSPGGVLMARDELTPLPREWLSKLLTTGEAL